MTRRRLIAGALVAGGLSWAVPGLMSRDAAAQAGVIGPAVQLDASLTQSAEVAWPRVDALRRAQRAAASTMPEDVEDAHVPLGGLALEWAELPSDTSQATLASGRTVLDLLNLDARAYAVEATVFGDAGTTQSRVRGGAARFTLPAGARQPIDVRVVAFGAPWRFSGAGAVHVRACPVDAPGAPCLTAISEPVYFHPDGSGAAVRAYGAAALQQSHRGGDLLGSSSGAGDPGTVRVMGGAPLTADPASDRAASEGR